MGKYRYQFFFLFAILFCTTIAFGQPNPGHSFNASNPDNSDYRILISYSYNSNYCNCGTQNTDIRIHRDLSLLGPVIATYSNNSFADEPFTVGPGYNEDLAASFSMSGRRTWLGTSAGTFCVGTICGGIIDNACPCGDIFGTPTVNVSTAAFKIPINVSASSIYEDQIVLNWGKGTDFPNSAHDYYIYRDGGGIPYAVIPAGAGGPYTFSDNNLAPGTNHTYEIRTHTSQFGDVESSGVSVEGSTFSIEASDGEFYNRSKISWSNVPSNTEDVRIERSIPFGSTEEIAILSKSATAYNDTEGIPGYTYTYYVIPLEEGNPIETYSDNGFSRPNGKISGYVRSPLGTGVSGVNIDVALLDTILPGGAMLPLCPVDYCTTTDASGYYEIKDIYYFQEAEFEITPSLMGHQYTPMNTTRTLSENAKTAGGVDFTDETVFTIKGRVTYPISPTNDTCGVVGAKILLDGNEIGVTTDADGRWGLTLLDENTYTFSIDYYEHYFEFSPGVSDAVLFVDQNILDVDFIDQEKGDIVVVVQGGCETPLGDDVEIQLSALQDCYQQTYFTGPDGYLVIEDLPAGEYSVRVIDIVGMINNEDDILTQFNQAIDLDLTAKDSVQMIMERDTLIITPESTDTLPNNIIVVTPADTMFLTVNDTILKPASNSAEFIYRSPLVITTNFEDAGATLPLGCTNSENEQIILMEQGDEYLMTFEIAEILNSDCPIDSGYLKIYDFVSDRGDNFIRVPIKNGIASYSILAGEPEISENTVHNHEKLLYVVPEVGFLVPEPKSYWIVVTGAKQLTPSFITKSPEVPMLVLHDPPGDNSYAFLEKGQSFKSFSTTGYAVEGAGGAFGKVGGGLKADIFAIKIKLGGFFEFEVEAGQNTNNEVGYETEITMTETFSTSSAENFTGDEGDVYVGASFNQEYSLGQTLDFVNCEFLTDTIPTLDLLGFATTFYYTEKHITQTLLPTIALLMEEFKEGSPNTATQEEIISFNRLRADSVSWGRILAANDLARGDNAVFEENLSFSAGAPVNRSITNSEATSVSFVTEVFVGGEFKAGVDFEFEGFGGYAEAQLGGMGRFKTTTTTAGGTDTGSSRTVGYVLDDGDIGDFFSIDVKTDTAFNVPAFDLVLGTSSCPHEEGTQTRDKPTITTNNPYLPNIPADEAAEFVALLTNRSESGETREYHVRVVSTTNPDGASVRLGGQLINNSAASFFLAPLQTLNVALDVRKGPQASNYERIGIMMYPPCEYALWQDNGVLKNVDTTYITVHFDSECSNVSLINPNDNWLVNQNDNDILQATFTGYDVNNPSFKSLTLEFKKEGQGYVDEITLEKEDLIYPSYDVYLDVSNYDDGAYKIRARADCLPGIGYTYSSELSGIIDRKSIAPFGTPAPSDGFLQAGQEVSVTFDKSINCDLLDYVNEITLIRSDDSTEITITPECAGDKIILANANELINIPSLDGVELTARVHLIQDGVGNVQKYPVEWSFLVNVKPVFWDPEFLYGVAQEGVESTMTGTLKNNALISKAFSLNINDDPGIQYPAWLTPKQTRGTILANNDYEVVFEVSPDLLPGIYDGVVTAFVDSQLVSMDVQFENLSKPVSWAFEPLNYQYSMNIVAQFSLTSADTPLSTDERDLIGAFVNGEIRGINHIEYVPEKDVYVAYLTIYSNDGGSGNEPDIQFRFWRALSGIEYAALETIPFVIDGQIGTQTNPFILHPEGIFQVIPLNVGWNWISLNVDNDDLSREKVFQSIISPLSSNQITVNSFDNTTSYTGGTGWQGNLKNLKLGSSYLVHLSDHPDTLRVIGTPPVSPIIFGAADEWNLIGYPQQSPQPIGIILNGIAGTSGDILKSQDAFALFDPVSNGWLGNLKEFEPGKGYKLFLNTGEDIIFNSGVNPLLYTYDASAFEYSMNVACTFEPSDLGEDQYEDLFVVAFVNGECRGKAEVVYIEELGIYEALLLVRGNVSDQNKEVTFSVVNRNSEVEYYGTGDYVEYAVDRIYRNVLDPYPIFGTTTAVITSSNKGFELFQNEPNPAIDMTAIGYYIPKAGNARLTLYDVRGGVIEVLLDDFVEEGVHRKIFSVASLPSGIYYYRLEAGDFTGVKKLLKH